MILDLGPATRGHALILPKDHYADLFELPDQNCEQMLKIAKKMGALMKERLGCSGMNLVQNNGEAAGQTVRHFHIHLIPRYDDGSRIVAWTPGEPSAEELAEIRDTICG